MPIFYWLLTPNREQIDLLSQQVYEAEQARVKDKVEMHKNHSFVVSWTSASNWMLIVDGYCKLCYGNICIVGCNFPWWMELHVMDDRFYLNHWAVIWKFVGFNSSLKWRKLLAKNSGPLIGIEVYFFLLISSLGQK
jgi:hypothetical protein